MRMCAAFVVGIMLAVTSSVGSAGENEIVSPELEQMLMREYSVTAETVDQVVEVGMRGDDIVVTFHVAQRAKMSPVHVANIRQQGGDWWQIAERRGLRPSDFYVQINTNLAPDSRYAAILGKFDFLRTSSWRDLKLHDDEIVDLVQARFISSACDYSILETIAMREEGQAFARILPEIISRKQEMLNQEAQEKKTRYASTGTD